MLNLLLSNVELFFQNVKANLDLMGLIYSLYIFHKLYRDPHLVGHGGNVDSLRLCTLLKQWRSGILVSHSHFAIHYGNS